jgi:tRNA A37 methylthiotransferase MiaB
LRKDANLKIFNLLAQGKLIRKTFNFAVQDTNETVLQNIDRPDVGWTVHAAMIDELHEKYPEYFSKIQMIYGLPGQTVASWRETLRTVTQKRLITRIFFNEPLPASPALTDPEYQRKFQFEYVVSNRISGGVGDYSTKIPKKCISFSTPIF